MGAGNHVSFYGNLTRDPELKVTKNNKSVTSFSIAVNDWKDTIFINCEAWGKQAESIAEYCVKGSPVIVEGALKKNEFQKQDGTQVDSYKVWVSSFKFAGKAEGGKKKENQGEAYDPNEKAEDQVAEEKKDKEKFENEMKKDNFYKPEEGVAEPDVPF